MHLNWCAGASTKNFKRVAMFSVDNGHDGMSVSGLLRKCSEGG